MSEPRFEIPERPLDDTERDGIAEEDNAIPLWFNASWLATWVIGAIYIVWYLAISDWSPQAQWAAEQAAAPAPLAAANGAAENPYRGDPAAIADGRETFATICLACHGPDGHGLVGPSLVDPYWKYGSSDAEHFKSVMDGRPGGMPPLGPQLGVDKVWKVLAYVESLPRTSEPGFGAPDYVPPPAPTQ